MANVAASKVTISSFTTPGRRQSKTLLLSTNVDQNSYNLSFRLPFVARLVTKMAIKNTFLANFHPRSSIVKSVFDSRLPGVFTDKEWQTNCYDFRSTLLLFWEYHLGIPSECLTDLIQTTVLIWA